VRVPITERKSVFISGMGFKCFTSKHLGFRSHAAFRPSLTRPFSNPSLQPDHALMGARLLCARTKMRCSKVRYTQSGSAWNKNLDSNATLKDRSVSVTLPFEMPKVKTTMPKNRWQSWLTETICGSV